ncbi:unnamed protein product [Enterobius vermicularis]|uniref:Uncharacterized protein n=1 Tax=Enterobius vermicularis TaxID=51028 RepID=A0A0N4VRN4_ENTVE|nr:unnamed protein product [Enterobius vermicularis]
MQFVGDGHDGNDGVDDDEKRIMSTLLNQVWFLAFIKYSSCQLTS